MLKKLLGLILVCGHVAAAPVTIESLNEEYQVDEISKLYQQLKMNDSSKEEFVKILQNVMHENLANESSIQSLSVSEWLKDAASGALMGLGAALALRMAVDLGIFCFKQSIK
jgi:ABC-type dipeptide/oligopeptide/nickel transport system permease component